MKGSLNVEKLYKESKAQLDKTKHKEKDLFKTYKTYEKKTDSLAKLYFLNTGNLIDYYVTYKMNPTSNDIIKKYQALQAKPNSTLSKVGVLGDSVKTSIEKEDKSLHISSKEIETLQNIYKTVDSMYRRLGDIDSTSEQMVYDYGTTYSMQNRFFWIQIVLVLGLAIYFFGVTSERGKNIVTFIAALALFYVIIIIIAVVRHQMMGYPDGPSNVTTTESTFQKVEDTIDDVCFEESCCAESTKWVSGEGCVAIEAGSDDNSESFITYRSMSQ